MCSGCEDTQGGLRRWRFLYEKPGALCGLPHACQSRTMSPEQIDVVRSALRSVEMSPLLHFNRMNAGRQETRRGGQSLVAAAPVE